MRAKQAFNCDLYCPGHTPRRRTPETVPTYPNGRPPTANERTSPIGARSVPWAPTAISRGLNGGQALWQLLWGPRGRIVYARGHVRGCAHGKAFSG